jgi:hypothetical protein|tara:strand:- start:145 stop:336 length:192 start_codon:yes stop_codon:yes gene_type:complete
MKGIFIAILIAMGVPPDGTYKCTQHLFDQFVTVECIRKSDGYTITGRWNMETRKVSIFKELPI